MTGGLWEKLLVNRETIARGDRVLLEDDERPFSDEERSIVRADIMRIYGAFLRLVEGARKIPEAELHRSRRARCGRVARRWNASWSTSSAAWTPELPRRDLSPAWTRRCRCARSADRAARSRPWPRRHPPRGGSATCSRACGC